MPWWGTLSHEHGSPPELGAGGRLFSSQTASSTPSSSVQAPEQRLLRARHLQRRQPEAGRLLQARRQPAGARPNGGPGVGPIMPPKSLPIRYREPVRNQDLSSANSIARSIDMPRPSVQAAENAFSP